MTSDATRDSIFQRMMRTPTRCKFILPTLIKQAVESVLAVQKAVAIDKVKRSNSRKALLRNAGSMSVEEVRIKVEEQTGEPTRPREVRGNQESMPDWIKPHTGQDCVTTRKGHITFRVDDVDEWDPALQICVILSMC